MKKVRFLCMALVSAMMLGGCSEENLMDGSDEQTKTPVDSGDGVYFTVNFDMPSVQGGSSVTTKPGDGPSSSNNGVEIGQGFENTVKSALVVLAKKSDHSFIAAAQMADNTLDDVSGNKSSYVVKSKISKADLQSFYDAAGGTLVEDANTVYIYVFANPSEQLTDMFGTSAVPADWYDKVLTYSDNMSGENNFLMSNALLAERAIPRTLNDWDSYKTQDNPFDLSGYNRDVAIDNSKNNSRGSIKIERSVARFDFRDGSEDGKTDADLNGIGNFTYQVVLDTDNKPVIDIVLEKMAVINMNKTFYALRRVSDDGRPTNPSYLGIGLSEKPWGATLAGNYVVDADYRWKDGVSDNTTDFADHFEYPLFSSAGTVNKDVWDATVCSSLVKDGNEDNDDSWNNGGLGQYYRWRYVTENVIASSGNFNYSDQKNGISTGVVFKGRMVADAKYEESNDKDLKEIAKTVNKTDAEAGDSFKAPILYMFAGQLYMGWEQVRAAAIAAAVPKWEHNLNDPNDSADDTWTPAVTPIRNDRLYVAVFGEGGGFGTVDVVWKDPDTGTEHKFKYEDKDLPYKADCADAAAQAWINADRPATGDLLDTFREKVVGADITIYQRSLDASSNTWGYYCYYYYWNRHNDNLKPSTMGPMEFAVVRNNVYKLAVTKISRLGHPRISENDPKKPTPDTKDETDDIYFTVTNEILPWVVRVNNIEF